MPPPPPPDIFGRRKQVAQNKRLSRNTLQRPYAQQLSPMLLPCPLCFPARSLNVELGQIPRFSCYLFAFFYPTQQHLTAIMFDQYGVRFLRKAFAFEMPSFA